MTPNLEQTYNIGDLALLKTDINGGKKGEPVLVINVCNALQMSNDVKWSQKVLWLMRPSGKLLGPMFMWELERIQ